MSMVILHIELRDRPLLPRSGAGLDPGEEGMVTGFRRYDGTLDRLVAKIFPAHVFSKEYDDGQVEILDCPKFALLVSFV